MRLEMFLRKRWEEATIIPMKRRCVFAIIALLISPASLFAQNNQTESLTITTYYPSPFGVYRNMQLYPSELPVGTAEQEGVMYYDKNTHSIRYRNDTGWQNITSGEIGRASCRERVCLYV